MAPPILTDDRQASMVALDWGTSSLRAYLLDGSGAVLAARTEPWGIMQIPGGDFGAALDEMTRAWRADAAGLPALACGMIGSAQGWANVPYRSTPAGVEELAGALAPVADGRLLVAPGLSQREPAPDVMRGEETQIVGALAAHPELASDALLVLPGTHSKWARVSNGRVRAFTTFLSGELFAVLSSSSILGRLARDSGRAPTPESAAEAFSRGVAAARGSASGMAPLLFSARAGVLLGRLEADASLEYLSGLIIGEEIRCGLAEGDAPRALIGDPALCARYAQALGQFGITGVSVIEDAAPAGLWTIAQHASLVASTTARVVA